MIKLVANKQSINDQINSVIDNDVLFGDQTELWLDSNNEIRVKYKNAIKRIPGLINAKKHRFVAIDSYQTTMR